jgi:multidrug resistance efflux pump
MTRNTALFWSGTLTALIMMLILGLVYGSGRIAAAAQATKAPVVSTDVAALQQQVRDYQAQLTQANADLAAAAAQIQQLQGLSSRRSGDIQSRDRRFPIVPNTPNFPSEQGGFDD